MAWNQTAMYVGITLGAWIGGGLIAHHLILLLFVSCATSALIGLIWYRFKVVS